jgi:hypothetical protein
MPPRKPDVEIDARASMRKLLVVTADPWEVSFAGRRSGPDTTRKNVPRAARLGEIYTDARIEVNLAAEVEEREESDQPRRRG